MFNKIEALMLKTTKYQSLLMVLHKTLLTLFPYALMGSFARVLAICFFSKDSLFGEMFTLYQWIPRANMFRVMLLNFSELTLGFIAVLCAYLTGMNMALTFKRDEQFAGITSMLAFLIICYQRIGNTVDKNGYALNWNWLGASGVLLAIFVGSIVGAIFIYFSPKTNRKKFKDMERNFRLIFIILISAVILNTLIYKVLTFPVVKDFITEVMINLRNQNTILGVIKYALVTHIFAWIGILGNSRLDSELLQNQFYVKNLNYALHHHSNLNIPYKYTINTLYNSYGVIGGLGSTLALLIAVGLVSKRQKQLKVVRLSFIPVMFNNNVALILGLPVLLNPVYMLPFVLIPVFNILIASFGIYFSLITPAVYPILKGTPAILLPFIGSGGDFLNIFIEVFLLVLDVLIYIPFVKFSEKLGGGK